MNRLKLLCLLPCLLWGLIADAKQTNLEQIKAPSSLENIHVVKLATDVRATDFVIFIKDKVPDHKHLTHTETILVLEGSGKMRLGDKVLNIVPGDYVRVGQGVVHGVKVTSSVPLKVLSVQAPEFLGKDRVWVPSGE